MRRDILDELKEKLETQLDRENKAYPFSIDDNYVDTKETDSIEIDDSSDLINEDKLGKRKYAFHLAEIDADSVISPYFGVNNHYAVSFFRNMTKGVIVMSYESSLNNALEVNKFDKNLGYLVRFNEPLMVAKHCVVSKACGYDKKKCGMCLKHKYQLKDKDRIYNLKFHNCIMRIEGREVKRNKVDNLVNIIMK